MGGPGVEEVFPASLLPKRDIKSKGSRIAPGPEPRGHGSSPALLCNLGQVTEPSCVCFQFPHLSNNSQLNSPHRQEEPVT